MSLVLGVHHFINPNLPGVSLDDPPKLQQSDGIPVLTACGVWRQRRQSTIGT
jgi:hypothetical protein